MPRHQHEPVRRRAKVDPRSHVDRGEPRRLGELAQLVSRPAPHREHARPLHRRQTAYDGRHDEEEPDEKEPNQEEKEWLRFHDE